MNRPRISVRMLAVAVALLAVDCAMIRIALAGNERVAVFNVVALPMANVLVLASFRHRERHRRGEQRPGLASFQAAGWTAMVVALILFLWLPWLGFHGLWIKLIMAFDPIRDAWFQSSAYRAAPPNSPTAIRIWWAAEISLLVAVSIALTAAQLLIARWGWAAAVRSSGPDRHPRP